MVNNKRNILRTLEEKLKEEQVRTVILPECFEEIHDIIENDIVCREFAATIYNDIMRYNEHKMEFLRKKNLFEPVSLDKGQKKRKKGPAMICSYKYKKGGKNNKNIRCIYITDEEKGWNIFLKCFVEKNNKGKKGDYRVAINDSIERYNNILKGNR